MRGGVWEQLGKGSSQDWSLQSWKWERAGRDFLGNVPVWSCPVCALPRALAAPWGRTLVIEMRWKQPGAGANGNTHLGKRRIQADLRALPVSKVLEELQRDFGKRPGGTGRGAMGQWGSGAAVSPDPILKKLLFPKSSCLHTNVILS